MTAPHGQSDGRRLAPGLSGWGGYRRSLGVALGATFPRQNRGNEHGDEILRTGPSSEGWYLVHNDVTPAKPLGFRGFRAWIQDSKDDLVECSCDFGGCRNAEVNRHYRVRRGA